MGIKRLVSFITLLALASGLAVAAALPAGAEGDDHWEEGQLRQWVNEERRDAGVPALRSKSDLNSIARRHAYRMAEEGYAYHNPNLKSEVKGWKAVGENVAMASQVYRAHHNLMSSPSHRDNILSRSYTEFGIGTVYTDRLYVVQVFRAPSGTSSQPAPEKSSEPAPKKSEPAPKKSEPAPKKSSEPAPKKSEPAPTKDEPAPKKSEPAAPRTVEMLVRLLGLS